MILDISVSLSLMALPLFLIGICLALYGKEILEVLSFPIGALAGGILAYMILRGLLDPFGVPLYVELIVGFIFVFIGGIMGSGTMVMVIALLLSAAVGDITYVFLGDPVLSTIAAAIFFAVVIYPTQKFLAYSSSAAGGILVAMGLFILLSLDPIPMIIIQIIVIFIFMIGGGSFQTWMKRRLARRKEESVWVPKMPAA
jgi:hypothetical protein